MVILRYLESVRFYCMMIVILIRTLGEGSVVGWMQSVTSWDEEGDSDSSCGGQHYGLFPMFLVRLGGNC